MLREAIDALGQECDLHLRRARVPFIGCVLPDHLLLAFGAERHRGPFQLLGRLKAAAAGMSSSRGRAKLAAICLPDGRDGSPYTPILGYCEGGNSQGSTGYYRGSSG